MVPTRSLCRSTAGCLLLCLCLCVTAKAQIPQECKSDWFPLETGNYWVYVSNSRVATAVYDTVRVLGPYELDGRVWCQLERRALNTLVRVDERGRVLERGFDSTLETLLLDPAEAREGTIESALGFTGASLDYTRVDPLLRAQSVWAKGIGRVSSVSTLLTGSSGGLVDQTSLVEAFVGGRLYRDKAVRKPGVELSAGSVFRNCALPCYFVACGMGSPVDPPNARKPCVEARMRGFDLPAGASLAIEISGENGERQWMERVALSQPGPTIYVSLPFYEQTFVGGPIVVAPAGVYRVTLTAFDAGGRTLASSWQMVAFGETGGVQMH